MKNYTFWAAVLHYYSLLICFYFTYTSSHFTCHREEDVQVSGDHWNRNNSSVCECVCALVCELQVPICQNNTVCDTHHAGSAHLPPRYLSISQQGSAPSLLMSRNHSTFLRWLKPAMLTAHRRREWLIVVGTRSPPHFSEMFARAETDF